MDRLQVFNDAETQRALPYSRLLPALQKAFASGATVPERHHHTVEQGDEAAATLLLMPAWQREGYLGVKIVSVFPGNTRHGAPALHSSYLLSSGKTGEPLAMLAGDAITSMRTAGVSALAASYLARSDASSLLIVGAGRVASTLAQAFAEVRRLRTVVVWSRNPEAARSLAARLQSFGFAATATESLEGAARKADIISCATLATDPLIKGEWLRPGTHLDLVGGFTPMMREADVNCFKGAAIYVDTLEAVKTAGDLLAPLARNVIDQDDVVGTLGELCSGRHQGRTSQSQRTVFKSVGTALADIAAASLAYTTIQSASSLTRKAASQENGVTDECTSA